MHFAALHAMPPEEWGSGLAVISDTEVRREVASLLEYSLKSDLAIGLTADAAFGRRIGPYRLVRRLGQGGQGAVFEAARDDGSFEQRVAVKIVRWEIDSDAARARFRSERQILAGLTHPHIGRLLDGGQTEHGTPYLVMEFIEGVPLTEATRGWPTRRKVELFLKVLAAVSYAHQNLIVHRDLKPGNILVTPDGSPKLLDFGIARLLDPDATQTATGQLAMTPQYASPEQVRGGVITTATDLYSLGVILYEMLTGRKPYVVEVTRPFEMARVICEQAPDAPGLGDELDDILLMALRKEPERRYGGAEQFAEDLRRYLDYRPIVARPDTLVYRSRKYMRRQWPLLAGVAAVMLALGGGVVASQYEARRAERRFQDLRSLAHSYLFNIDKRIQNLPGSTDAREEIVRTGLAYLEHLSNEAGHDRDLWAELGAGYLAVGDVLGDPFVSNLGKLDEALAAYRKARDIALVLTARDASDRRSLELLGSSYLRIGDSIYTRVDSTGMLENYKRSVEVGEKLRAAGHPPYEMLAGGYRGIGWSILGQPANPAEALEAYRRGLRAAEQWWEAEQGENSAAALMDAHRDVGQALKVMGDLPGAMEEQRKAEDLAYELHQKHPGNATYAYRLGSVWC
ncbi:MAG TPA: serine/threonine-protein kinase, partial [Bryobacteraceae bacterium]